MGRGTGAFDSQEYVNRLGLNARMHTASELDSVLAPFEWHLDRWFGVRVLTDHLDEDPPPALELARIVAVEQEAGRRDPLPTGCRISPPHLQAAPLTR